MKQITFYSRIAAAAAVALLAMTTTFVSADDEAEEPEDATVYAPPKAAALRTGGNSGAQAAPLVVQPGFRSKKLKGEFIGKPMYVEINGQSYPFWGARAVVLDQDSPLRKLGMVEGDVLSRLDGMYLNNGKHMQNGIWHMPELDAHYGLTDVKWIKQGTHRVNIGQIVIDSGRQGNPGGRAPVPEAP